MAIHLTEEQEQRIQAVIGQGSYQSPEEVLDAALSAVEQRIVPGFSGTQEELDMLLGEGLVSPSLCEQEFWKLVDDQTATLLADHKVQHS